MKLRSILGVSILINFVGANAFAGFKSAQHIDEIILKISAAKTIQDVFPKKMPARVPASERRVFVDFIQRNGSKPTPVILRNGPHLFFMTMGHAPLKVTILRKSPLEVLIDNKYFSFATAKDIAQYVLQYTSKKTAMTWWMRKAYAYDSAAADLADGVATVLMAPFFIVGSVADAAAGGPERRAEAKKRAEQDRVRNEAIRQQRYEQYLRTQWKMSEELSARFPTQSCEASEIKLHAEGPPSLDVLSFRKNNTHVVRFSSEKGVVEYRHLFTTPRKTGWFSCSGEGEKEICRGTASDGFADLLSSSARDAFRREVDKKAMELHQLWRRQIEEAKKCLQAEDDLYKQETLARYGEAIWAKAANYSNPTDWDAAISELFERKTIDQYYADYVGAVEKMNKAIDDEVSKKSGVAFLLAWWNKDHVKVQSRKEFVNALSCQVAELPVQLRRAYKCVQDESKDGRVIHGAGLHEQASLALKNYLESKRPLKIQKIEYPKRRIFWGGHEASSFSTKYYLTAEDEKVFLENEDQAMKKLITARDRACSPIWPALKESTSHNSISDFVRGLEHRLKNVESEGRQAVVNKMNEDLLPTIREIEDFYYCCGDSVCRERFKSEQEFNRGARKSRSTVK